MATKKVKRFQEGGVSDKDRGLEASKDDKVSFFERLRMGNIDEEGSEAYRRFGAGRGKAERTLGEVRVANPTTKKSAPVAPEGVIVTPISDSPAQFKRDAMEEANARAPIAVPAGPRASSPPSPARSTPATSALPKLKSDPYQDRPASAPRSNYSNEGRGREMTRKQQAEREIDSIMPTEEQIQKGLENAALPGVGLKALSAAAKKLAAPKLAKYFQEALPAPTKRLTYDKAGAVARKRSERASARQDEMLKENVRRYGLDKDAPGYKAAADAVRKELGGKDFGLKKGGAVKRSAPMKKMSSGGAAKSSMSMASKRADGIAQRGKTRGKVC